MRLIILKDLKKYPLLTMDITPKELAEEIKQTIPNFTINYRPDSRQKIADSWPQSIDDTKARKDWNWSHNFTISSMAKDILKNLQAQKVKN